MITPTNGSTIQNPEAPIPPTVVVLMHGKTTRPDRAPEQGINTRAHPYYYWGFGFVQGLLYPGGNLLQIRGDNLQGSALFDQFMWDSGGFTREEYDLYIRQRIILRTLLHYYDILSGFAEYDSGVIADVRFYGYQFTYDKITAGDYSEVAAAIDEVNSTIRRMETAAYSRLGTMVTAPATGPGLPNYSVMLTYRDGSRSLGEQAAAAVNQIYERYQENFGSLAPAAQPQIVLFSISRETSATGEPS